MLAAPLSKVFFRLFLHDDANHLLSNEAVKALLSSPDFEACGPDLQLPYFAAFTNHLVDSPGGVHLVPGDVVEIFQAIWPGVCERSISWRHNSLCVTSFMVTSG
eukprot:GHUV01003062.1.p2 GENE.GHUV01003062.1~~GHUV01003062.1.p2  ORF type:complete len:104 (+),score=11.35 GHUV01003062.1:1055-1366(+)